MTRHALIRSFIDTAWPRSVMCGVNSPAGGSQSLTPQDLLDIEAGLSPW
jgi:hypothetical protein